MAGTVGGKKARQSRQLIRLRILDKRKERKAIKLLQEASINWTALQQKREKATEDEEKSVPVKDKKKRKSKLKSLEQSSNLVVVETSDSPDPHQSHDLEDKPRQQRTKTDKMKRRRLQDDSGDSCSNRKRTKWESSSAGPSTSREVSKRKEDGGEKKTLRREDLWFDDVAVDIVGGEVIAKQQPLRHNMSQPTELVTGSDNKARGCIAIDCEMVGGGSDGSINLLARCSIVNHHGNVIYDKYVQPIDTISDYRTKFSGIRPSHLKDATPFKTVQNEVSELLKDRILVGHSVQNDLKVLFLSHPKHSTRDTARYRPFKRAVKTRTPSLKKLAKELLDLDIQTGEHDSVIDARVAMKLYQLHKFQWEHAHGTQWSDQRRGDHKWLPRGRRAQQKKKGMLHSYSSRHEEGTSQAIEPFNVMLHTDQ